MEVLSSAGQWASEHPGYLLLGAAGGWLTWWAFRPLEMWRMRKVPGTWAPPFVGHIPAELAVGDIHDYCAQIAKRFPVASRFWFGSMAVVLVHDPDAARRALTKYVQRPDLEYLAMRFGEQRDTWYAGLLWQTGGVKWRTARRAFEAAVMHPKNLAVQAPFVAQCAARLAAALQRYADSGEPADVLQLTYNMTLDAIGYTAFGLDLQASCSLDPASVDAVASVTLSDGAAKGKAAGSPAAAKGKSGDWWEVHPLGSAEFGRHLVECAVGVMKAMNIEITSIYNLLPLLFPGFKPLLRLLGRVLPDKAMRVEQEHYRGLLNACKMIVKEWRECQEGKKGMVISEQGFIARLLSDQSNMPGVERLSDLEVIGNVIMMVVGGYETTGSSIASTLYLLAHNPEAQRKAQRELDDVLGGKEVTPDDLDRLPYLAAVFQETLRVKAAASCAPREVTDESFHIGQGITVPKGTYLLMPTLSIMQSDKMWPRASEFLPERHLPGAEKELGAIDGNAAAFMPFGAGARMCPGYKFATLEARMALARLLQRFSFEPAKDAPPPKWMTSAAYSPDKVILSVKTCKESAAAK